MFSDCCQFQNKERERSNFFLLSALSFVLFAAFESKSDCGSLPHYSASLPQSLPPSSRSPSPLPPPSPKRTEPPTFDDLGAASVLGLGIKRIEIGTLVSLKSGGIAAYGVIRWTGCLPDLEEKAAGIELVRTI